MQKDTLSHVFSDATACNKVTTKSNLYHSDLVAVKELKSNDNIFITEVDKGGQIVLMDKKDYFDKGSILLKFTFFITSTLSKGCRYVTHTLDHILNNFANMTI